MSDMGDDILRRGCSVVNFAEPGRTAGRMLGSVTEAFAIMGKHDDRPSGEQSITNISSVSRRRSARIFWNPCRFDGDKAHHALLRGHRRRVRRNDAAAKDFPGGPAPEVDVQIAQVLHVRADSPLDWRHPGAQRRRNVPGAALSPGLSLFPCTEDCRSSP